MTFLNAGFQTLRWLWQHPLAAKDRPGAITRWLRWQLGSRILGSSAVVSFVDDTVLLVDPGMAGATGNIYVGLHEFADMAFVLHFLREGDRFLDVGANVGTYTILASGVCGAESLAVEPIPRAFERLCANVRLNDIASRVRLHNVGLAAKPGRLSFTSSLDTANHVVRGEPANGGASIEVPVVTLDELVSDRCPILVKVDAEGFEEEVVSGGSATLANATLQALLFELNEPAAARYGFSNADLTRRFESFGFRRYTYEPFARRLAPEPAGAFEGNGLFLRNADAVQRRLADARPFRVNGRSI
ncbi:MAG TPA: FkbM family methyltransferase [Polyangiaceae bacterium]|jgi:FkbM family methyltransferase|nr:FkbM family methyltransferase [Polyangiaceae bacterium]